MYCSLLSTVASKIKTKNSLLLIGAVPIMKQGGGACMWSTSTFGPGRLGELETAKTRPLSLRGVNWRTRVTVLHHWRFAHD